MAKSYKKILYENYCANMKFYGVEILPYKEWLKMVESTVIPTKSKNK